MVVPAVPLASDDLLTESFVLVHGDDAARFLQGQISQDVENLEHERRYALLSPSGELIANGKIALSGGNFSLSFPTALEETVHARLRRFALRVKMVLDTETTIRERSWREDFESAQWGATEMNIALGLHSYGARCIADCVSFSKGCYTGQELVGRLDARGGNVPFRLARVWGPAIEAIAALVEEHGPTGERAIQRVTSWQLDDNEVRAWALVHRSLTSASHEEIRVEWL